jgi:hypothetical protein
VVCKSATFPERRTKIGSEERTNLGKRREQREDDVRMAGLAFSAKGNPCRACRGVSDARQPFPPCNGAGVGKSQTKSRGL